MIATIDTHRSRYMAREPLPPRRTTWRQKVRITDTDSGTNHTFYVDFGEYPDGRLAEVFITCHKTGTFVRGTLDVLAQSISLALQSGTHPIELAKTLRGQSYPPCGPMTAEGSEITSCLSIADYVGQEIQMCYGEDGKRKPRPATPEKVAGTIPPDSGV